MPIFNRWRNIIAKCFKRNVTRSFVRYMVNTYGTSSSVCHGEIRKKGERDMEAGLESLD